MATKRPARPTAPKRPVPSGHISLAAVTGITAAMISILAAVLGALYGYWNTQRTAEEARAENVKIRSDFSVEIARCTATIGTVAERVNGIDKAGTDYGRSAYSAQNVERTQVKKDVADMQETLRILVPTVTEINANVRWLMSANNTGPVATPPPALARPRALRAFRGRPALHQPILP